MAEFWESIFSNPFFSTLFGVFAGGFITIVVAIVIEHTRKPRLDLRIKPYVDQTYHPGTTPVQSARFLYVELVNQPLPVWARWTLRSAATQCYGHITFHHIDDGQQVLADPMRVRWSSTVEPPFLLRFNNIGGKDIAFLDFVELKRIEYIDVQPGRSETLDVAARFDDNLDCYGWNNDSYFSDPPWRNPKWKLAPGRYIVRVTIYHAGEQVEGYFRLSNNTEDRDNFRLEPAPKEDIGKVRQWI
jgi:hypothetical protein